MDREFWPNGLSGAAEDPFVPTFYIVLRSLPDADQEHLFSLILQKSNCEVAYALLEEVAIEGRKHPEDDPVVTLESAPSENVTKYGHRPVLRLVGWTPHIEIEAVPEQPEPAVRSDAAETKPKLVDPQRTPKLPTSRDFDLNDDVGF